MSQSKIRKGATSAGVAGDTDGCLSRYIPGKWAAPVFVAACVTIAHLGFSWLDAVDSYAFLALGNRVSSATRTAAAPTIPDEDSVVVVRIDEQTFLKRYLERTPLNRCALSNQLSAIYKAEPEILVIDLDLSPAVVDEGDCQRTLHATLAQWAKKTRTVVMEPFDSFDPALTASRGEWRRQMEKAGVRFGDAALPVNYGMALHYYIGGRALYAAARRNEPLPPIADDASPPSLEHRMIDVRAYRENLLPVLTSWVDTPEHGEQRDEDLTDTLRMLWDTPLKRKVVFFGAGFGQEDTYLTPVGKLYGVEVHAAAFWSSDPARTPWQRVRHVSALVIEVLIAFVFGVIIAGCWMRYFAWRSDRRSMHEQLAWIWVAIMFVSLLVVIAACLALAAILLSSFGIWLSPIPLAAGMLVESYVTGSVEAAVRELHRIPSKHAAGARAPDSITRLLCGCTTAIWVLALLWAVKLAAHFEFRSLLALLP